MMIDDMESRPTGNDQLFGIYYFFFQGFATFESEKKFRFTLS